ncbi:hypothetical protein Salat_2567700 [Sesamum alatum]|uniref:Uncharacterized protein n=1 Tax=Sesamum alatum TaxID=300844 RepID=A0AAE1XTP4_9LAMI|nr:hypothetical protein Salat_2567700 [Sesamum alatum]
MPDWGEGTDWDQISLEVSNFLETGNFSSQSSFQQPVVTTMSSQSGPTKKRKSVANEKQPARRSTRLQGANPIQGANPVSNEVIAQPARRSTRLQGTNPISNEVIAQQATNTVRSNFNPPRRMPTTNLPNPAPIPPARGGVTIRPPVPFARGHPRVPLGISMQKMTPIQHQFKVIDKDSQKYVTMKGLEDALNARREAANKARKELDGKGKKL